MSALRSSLWLSRTAHPPHMDQINSSRPHLSSCLSDRQFAYPGAPTSQPLPYTRFQYIQSQEGWLALIHDTRIPVSALSSLSHQRFKLQGAEAFELDSWVDLWRCCFGGYSEFVVASCYQWVGTCFCCGLGGV